MSLAAKVSTDEKNNVGAL